MRLLIQKFGGTSVQTKENRKHVIKQIKRALEKDYKLVVVVSALGRNPDPYATDTLLQMVDYPTKTQNSKRELDMLMSCGETIASVVLSNELQHHHISATALTGAQAGLITNDEYNEAKIKKVKPDRIKHELKNHDVVVVAGFQGRTESGDITTIGRGGSDTTAAAFGASLRAECIEIFTDVKGIMTADPRVVDSARPIDVVTYTETCNLAYQGAKVIHPRAVEIAMQAEIPLRIRSTYSNEIGTLITSSRGKEIGIDIPDRLVTSIAHIDDISQLSIKVNETDLRAQATIFQTMADASISVDFINISPTSVIYTVPSEVTTRAIALLEEKGFSIEVTENCAKVSAVGAGMTGIPGVAAKIANALVKNNVQILQSADSHTTIWVLIYEKHLKTAVNALHDVFELNKLTEIEKT
ncbi:aspartate kinase [Pseudogracilibacillus auburnensis]|uniref:Aspartokinase n=1 Tax=Pseudogracilibacillus auburnensis TaxID=1494959 RepID=A0A2V3W6K6_9BACI|nr:aspartate kinase [Pseudogracilibacillus auburnensis]PXW88661.1 aspartate kinase [Pseudogracilibacillus auburnensis]